MKLWESLEKEVESLVKGRATPGSGRFSTKGDVRVHDLYIECKHRTITSKSKGLPISWLKTAEINTKSKGLTPVLAVKELRNGVPTGIFWFCRLSDSGEFETVPQVLSCDPSWVQISQESVRSYEQCE